MVYIILSSPLCRIDREPQRDHENYLSAGHLAHSPSLRSITQNIGKHCNAIAGLWCKIFGHIDATAGGAFPWQRDSSEEGGRTDVRTSEQTRASEHRESNEYSESAKKSVRGKFERTYAFIPPILLSLPECPPPAEHWCGLG